MDYSVASHNLKLGGFMRYLVACMLLGLSAGYAQEVADETPPAEVTSTDEGSGQVASVDSLKSLCSAKKCPCGNKPK